MSDAEHHERVQGPEASPRSRCLAPFGEASSLAELLDTCSQCPGFSFVEPRHLLQMKGGLHILQIKGVQQAYNALPD